jgi:hypothetical protein
MYGISMENQHDDQSKMRTLGLPSDIVPRVLWSVLSWSPSQYSPRVLANTPPHLRSRWIKSENVAAAAKILPLRTSVERTHAESSRTC